MDASHAPPARQVNAWAQRRRRPTRAQKLAAAARAAADVRAYDTDPDVVALRIERLRTRVDRLIWTGLVLGLLFTMANVQHFAAQGAATWSIPWWIAWLLDPMVSLVLVGVLLGEQIIARHQIQGGRWIRRTKWTALGLTYAMNTWSAWAKLDPALILLHSVPPIMVFCAAEAVTTLKHQITTAVHKAYHWAAERAAAINEATEEAVARAKAIADAHTASEPASNDQAAGALADLTAWTRRRVLGVTEQPTSVAAADTSPTADATGQQPAPRPATALSTTTLTVVDTVAPPVADDDEDSDRDGDRERDSDSDRERPDDQDNREAEDWIRRRCRGQNGVGRRPTKTEVAERYDFSETWGLKRVQTVQKRMTAQGYEFRPDGTVLAPHKTVASTDNSQRSEATA
ncbi:hypothetical protein DMB42_11390 [Nonomuraea sp. WAC 01424]|uniref:hypothetical protein n=1 Tax=Nonomuraea sp. WAC 01424 TaxID=2203200 RepID=UPI000F798CF3|nr:hypothetical protein [Nonomuraea sp. WAC 01424]RSN12775.1 hypothetical protein DMB42_11390 [Nonomuraea sp. WAC 01424]